MLPPSASFSRSLSPSSPPFIFPRSSPTFTSHSDTDTDTTTTCSSSLIESSSSSISTSHALTPTASASSRFREKGDIFPTLTTLASAVAPIPGPILASNSLLTGSPTKAKPFGAGWKSTSTGFSNQMNDITSFHPAPQDHQHDQDASATRSRSPSFPNFPAQDHTKSVSGQYVTANSRDLFPINTTSSVPHDFELYTPTSPQGQGYLPFGNDRHYPFPTSPTDSITASTLYRHHSTSTINIELDDHATSFPTFTSSPTGLLHHQSVPNLPFQQSLSRRPSGMSVRFRDEAPDVPQGVDGDGMQRGLRRMPGFNFGQLGTPRTKLTGSKSMPAIQMVGEGRNVFIHRVNANLGEDGLREYASEFGDVVSVKIPIRTTKPHAFVMFKKPEQAQRFIVHLKMGNIECEFGKEDYQVQNKALEDPNSANLYVAGLPTTMTYDELADLLAPGRICSWKPLVDEAGNRRGPVMARLQTRPQAEDVIRRLNGKYYPGMSEKLQVRIADSDEQKQFKRQQNVWRERVPPDEFGRHIVTPENIYGHPESDQDEVPGLLDTREYLASQLQAIDQKLSRTSITPRQASSIAFPRPRYAAAFDEPIYPPGMYDGPASSDWEDNHSRQTSNDFSSEPWATGIIGPAPVHWAPARSTLPSMTYERTTNDQTHSKSVTPTHSRQQALSLGSLAQTQHGLGGDLWAAAGISLKNVKSSPQLGRKSERPSRLD
ncbi:hypothetical protein IAU59_005188 [Kwoniella sp. CBS 9459]